MSEKIVCVECGNRADGNAAGWQAHLLDVDDDGQDEPVFYCRSCAASEFGNMR